MGPSRNKISKSSCLEVKFALILKKDNNNIETCIDSKIDSNL